MYRVGVIGFGHMHVNSLVDDFAAHPQVEWAACADTVPHTPSLSDEPGTRKANLRRALEYTGIPRQYDEYRELLDKESCDIVIVCSENALHGEVVEAAADAGCHVLVEKPMASDFAGALRMVRAARLAGVRLVVNWPSTWFPAVRKAQALVAEGAVGRVLKFKYRNGASLGPLAYGQQVTEAEKRAEWWHQAAAGGGAYLDYCCYGANLSRWFLGEPPLAAYGVQANLDSWYGDADDNGVVVARYPGAVAILEGSWTTLHVGVTNGPLVFGTEGTLVVEGHKVLVYRDKGHSEPTAVYDELALPEGRTNIAEEMLHHLDTGEPLHPTLDLPVNVDAMALLDAGLRSAESGQLELVER